MSFSYENQGTNTFLVYAVAPEDNVDSMSLGMLTNNKIAGLAPSVFTQQDATKYIKYNVSAKVSVKQFFSGAVNKKRLLGVFNGIVDAMLSAEDYMIDAQSIILDLDYIFTDVSTCETVLICLPIDNKTVGNIDLGVFFKNIMFTTQFDQTENCDHVAKIINYLNSAPAFSLADFKEVLNEFGTNGIAEEPPRTVHLPQQPVMNQQPAPKPVAQPIQQPIPQPVPQPAPQVQPVPQSTVPPKVNPVPNPMPQPVPGPQGMNIPGGAPMSVPPQGKKDKKAPQPMNMPNSGQGAAPVPGEKQISMLYLLQHYNKENAELYKAQKAAKKAAATTMAPMPGGQPVPPMPPQGQRMTPPMPPQGQRMTPPMPSQGGAIPPNPNQGKTPNGGFAIPGQQAPPVMNSQSQPMGQPAPGGKPQPMPQTIQQSMPGGRPQPAPQPTSQQVQQVAPVQVNPAGVPEGGRANFGETTVLSGGPKTGETTVLGATSAIEVKPHLIRTKNNERINLDKPVFRIGKEKSYVDYFISDNTAISRSHANIISRNGEYFVVDTNSTNHTYVNGTMIQSNVETKISHGAKIKFANENFEFRLY